MEGLFRIDGVADIFVGVQTGAGSRPHFHDGYSIGIFGGGARICARGKVFDVEDGQLAVLEPGEVHGGHCGINLNRQYGAVLAPEMVERLFGSAHPIRFECPVIADARLTCALKTAIEGGHERALIAAVLMLFQRHGEPVREARASAANRAIADESMINQVSGKRLSRSHFSRKVKALTGLAPRDYRRQRRVEAARALIEQGGELAKVAVETGFADQAHMTRQMRSLLGVTPGMLRRSSG